MIELDDENLDTAIVLEEEAETLFDDELLVKPKRKKREKKPAQEYVNKNEMWEEIRNYYELLGDGYDNELQIVKNKKCHKVDITHKLSVMIDDIATKLGYRPNFISYCVDDDTQALTKRGWVSQNEINESDSILSYDTEDGKLKWSNIKSIFRNHEYNSKMFKLSVQGMDALVTPSHKFVVKDKGLVPIEEIKTQDQIIVIGEAEQENKTAIYTDYFIELVGWCVTEGHYAYGKAKHSITITQNEGIHSDMIRTCLKAQNAHYKEYRKKNTIQNSFYLSGQLANKIIDLAPSRVLSTEFILSLPHKQRLLLIETMIDGDGWIRKNKLTSAHKTSWSYCQKCRKHIDAFLMLCTLSGLTTSTVLRSSKGNKYSHNPYYVVNIFRNPQTTIKSESINFHGGRASAGGNHKNMKGSKPNKPTVDYKGTVWCPETEYGTFMARRGRYIYVTGNTYLSEMRGDAKVKMIKCIRDGIFKCWSRDVEIVEKVDTDKGVKMYFHCAKHWKKHEKLKERIMEPDDIVYEKDGKEFATFKNNAFGYFSGIATNSFLNRIKKEKQIEETKRTYQEMYWENVMATEQFKHVRKPKIIEHDENEGFFEGDY